MTKRHIYTFGAFRLDPQQKILLRDRERIPLCPKTFATLLALIESSGAVITKDELLEKVWPDTFVEENNLTKNISLLRKALSPDHHHSAYIETIPTVGYRFVEPVRRVANGDAVIFVERELFAILPVLRRFWLRGTRVVRCWVAALWQFIW